MEYVLEVLRIMEEADLYDDIFWRVDPRYDSQDLILEPRFGEPVRFFANCSDFFDYASADSEEILPTDLPLFRQCLVDLKKIDCEYMITELFSARKRGRRPLQSIKWENDKLAKLFEEIGDE